MINANKRSQEIVARKRKELAKIEKLVNEVKRSFNNSSMDLKVGHASEEELKLDSSTRENSRSCSSSYTVHPSVSTHFSLDIQLQKVFLALFAPKNSSGGVIASNKLRPFEEVWTTGDSRDINSSENRLQSCSRFRSTF